MKSSQGGEVILDITPVPIPSHFMRPGRVSSFCLAATTFHGPDPGLSCKVLDVVDCELWIVVVSGGGLYGDME